MSEDTWAAVTSRDTVGEIGEIGEIGEAVERIEAGGPRERDERGPKVGARPGGAMSGGGPRGRA
ncbi:hypothetical protein [Streptomyces sp. NPDC052494]|uniref:hypothetical protein n=1 Tax=Streptomyces sp. NPDC052494 TaxID=3365692 RepID=UPI0037D88275